MTLREYDYEKEPVVSIVKNILTDAINMKASDIHFDPSATKLSIKFRINGNLQEYTIAPETIKSNITTRIKILSNMIITDSLHPQTGILNFELDGKHYDMRVSSLPVCDGEKIVLSIHNYESNIKSLSKMGLNPIDTEKIKKLVKSNQGLVLITGTTSSGKTTTMYAMLKEIQSKSLNIISIEDPVKMKLDGINQVEIAPDKGITYKSALKHVMLQDPNIICIDNLIDDEIAREAIRASITGRLIISSIYTKNAYTTIDSLLNMEIENYLLSSNLNGIISQRLVKQLCPKCKEKRYTTEFEKTLLKKFLNKNIDELYYPKGCEECHNGYIGQIPIVEVVEITDEIKNAITNKKDSKTIRELLYKDNTPIIINGFNKVLEGVTSFNEIIKTIDIKIDLNENQNDIKDYLLGKSTKLEIKKEEIVTPVIVDTEPTLNDIETEQLIITNENNDPIIIDESELTDEDQTLEPPQVETIEEIIEETISTAPPKQMPTEGKRLIEEVNELFQDDEETINILAEILNENTIEEQTTENIQEEIIEENIIKEITEDNNEDSKILNEIEDLILQTEEENTEPTNEINNEENQTIETNETEIPQNDNIKVEVQEEKSNENTTTQEINIPKPIEANIVEENISNIISDDDDDDDDENDFGYGEEYENSF